MHIVIENCSSPGAHFSNNTNNVLLKINSWIVRNNRPDLMFIDFRRRLEKEERINDNNARNIYPLVKNCGLVEYQPGAELQTSSFFTKRGLAYLKALQTKTLIENEESYTKAQRVAAIDHVDQILHTIIYESMFNLVNNPDLNYSKGLRWFLEFLRRFGKVDKREFALMVYEMTNNPDNWYQEIAEYIQKYRAEELSIDAKVRVRNDQKIQSKTGQTTRLEDLSFFTCYSFYSGLVQQAGLIRKSKDYFVVVEGADNKIVSLLEAH